VAWGSCRWGNAPFPGGLFGAKPAGWHARAKVKYSVPKKCRREVLLYSCFKRFEVLKAVFKVDYK